MRGSLRLSGCRREESEKGKKGTETPRKQTGRGKKGGVPGGAGGCWGVLGGKGGGGAGGKREGAGGEGEVAGVQVVNASRRQSTAVHPVQDGAKPVRPVQGRDCLVLRRPHPVLDGRDDWI